MQWAMFSMLKFHARSEFCEMYSEVQFEHLLINRAVQVSSNKVEPNASGAGPSRSARRSSVMRLNLHVDGAIFYSLEDLSSGAVESSIDPTRREVTIRCHGSHWVDY